MVVCNTGFLLYDVSSMCVCVRALRAQAAVHEPPLLERHPPLAGLAGAIRVQFLDQSLRELLPDLGEVAPEVLCSSHHTGDE